MELNTAMGSKASMKAHGPKSMVSPDTAMLSVFMTPWMNPTCIQLAMSDAWASVTALSSPRYGRSSLLAAGVLGGVAKRAESQRKVRLAAMHRAQQVLGKLPVIGLGGR